MLTLTPPHEIFNSRLQVNGQNQFHNLHNHSPMTPKVFLQLKIQVSQKSLIYGLSDLAVSGKPLEHGL